LEESKVEQRWVFPRKGSKQNEPMPQNKNEKKKIIIIIKTHTAEHPSDSPAVVWLFGRPSSRHVQSACEAAGGSAGISSARVAGRSAKKTESGKNSIEKKERERVFFFDFPCLLLLLFFFFFQPVNFGDLEAYKMVEVAFFSNLYFVKPACT
jgi:hypothetical protein